jgi:Cytochrome b5-like Heme/Steroid binding domain
MTNFLDEHPGGKKILQRVLGHDASKQFWKFHNQSVLAKFGPPLKLGTIQSKENKQPAQVTKYPPPKPAVFKSPSTSDDKSANEIFGEVFPFKPDLTKLIPFAEPSWYTGLSSPYYNISHHRLRTFMRSYMDQNITPHVFEWEESKIQPKELFKTVAQQGFIAAAMYPLPPKEYMDGVTLPGGIKVVRFTNLVNYSMKNGMRFTILYLTMNSVESVHLVLQCFCSAVSPYFSYLT